MTTPPTPFPRSYWVVPGKLLAGYYPGAKDPNEAKEKITALLNAGIRHFINLMEADRDLGTPIFAVHKWSLAREHSSGH